MRKFKRILSFFLTVIIVLSCFSVSMMTASAAEIDSSSASGTSTVEYTVDPGWTATIPAYIKAADQGRQNPDDYTVTIRNVLLGDMQKLVATIDYDGVLSESNGIQLEYSLYDSDGKIKPEKKFAEIPAGDPDAEYTYSFGAALDEKPKYAGNYLGTVTFNIAVEDIYYTSEEIEKNPLLIPIGKTVPEYVLAEFNEDYSSVTIFKNGADSDGVMMDFYIYYTDSPMYLNRNTLKSAEIQSNVKNVGPYAFFQCSELKSVNIGNDVEIIDESAFGGCGSLTDVTIGNKVKTIANNAFNMCTSLPRITMPNSVTSIGYMAFWNCYSLVEVTFGNSIDSIGYEAFCRCSALENIVIPNSVTFIGESAFEKCSSLQSVMLGNGIESIEERTFQDCTQLMSVSILKNVTSIGKSAFKNCSSMQSATISESVEIIAGEAFYGCSSLQSITIPDNVTELGQQAFRSCTSLNELNIGNGVTSLPKYAFTACTSLTSVVIPDNITTMDYSFRACSSLREVTIGKGITSMSQSPFQDCPIEIVHGYSGTYAETWANNNGYTFIPM